MASENAEIVWRMYEAVGTPAVLDYYDPGVLLSNSPNSPDTQAYRGHAGIVAWARDVREGAGDFRLVAEETIDAGDGRVVVVGEVRGVGPASGLPINVSLTTVFTLRNRRIVRVQAYETKADALEAVGLAQ